MGNQQDKQSSKSSFEEQLSKEERTNPRISRRDFLEGGSAGLAASLGWGAALLPPRHALAAEAERCDPRQRQARACQIRRDAAQSYLLRQERPEGVNGDEERYADRRASFSKTLPHNELGEVDPKAYVVYLSILTGGDPDRFEAIPRDPEAQVKLNDPQAAYAYDLVSLDSHATRVSPPPAFDSARMAWDMGEVYWQALTLDVPFRAYETQPLAAAAVSDLNAFSECAGTVTPGTLFRGETAGDRIGPYLSQFLWQEVPYGIHAFEQRYRFPSRGQSFLTRYPDWLACQRGVRPTGKLEFDTQPRFICSGRELAEYVHQDFSFQSYLNAALIMLRFGEEALSPTNPYRGSRTQLGALTFGHYNVLSMVAQAALIGQKGAWYHKWLVHRRLRPESFAGRIENHRGGRKTCDIHTDILRCEAVARLLSANRTCLLPLAYPEGCPTHPSYPSAHAANAGACATILKAFFNEAFVFPHPVQAKADGSGLEPWQGPALTLGSEINKLAANITLGRDAAGVHYRSDGVQGILVGEAQAIGILCDYSRTYNERFDGFTLTRFDGQKIRIRQGSIARV
jgi:hypothetical protein